MVAPLAGAVGVAANVAIEYGYQRYRGNQGSFREFITSKEAIGAGLLGVIPGLGLIKSAPKGLPVLRQIGDVPFYRLRGLGAQVGPYSQEAYALYLVGNRQTRKLLGGGLRGLAYNRILSPYLEPVESSVRSLTSSTQKAGTTTRVPGAKRYTTKKTSRRTAFSGDARRRTTYCKRHKQYDFCEKYNIRK